MVERIFADDSLVRLGDCHKLQALSKSIERAQVGGAGREDDFTRLGVEGNILESGEGAVRWVVNDHIEASDSAKRGAQAADHQIILRGDGAQHTTPRWHTVLSHAKARLFQARHEGTGEDRAEVAGGHYLFDAR